MLQCWARGVKNVVKQTEKREALDRQQIDIKLTHDSKHKQNLFPLLHDLDCHTYTSRLQPNLTSHRSSQVLGTRRLALTLSKSCSFVSLGLGCRFLASSQRLNSSIDHLEGSSTSLSVISFALTQNQEACLPLGPAAEGTCHFPISTTQQQQLRCPRKLSNLGQYRVEGI